MFRNLRPLSLCVAISSALGLPVYASTTILPGEIYENPGYLDNYDWIDNYGYFINSSAVNNYSYYDQNAYHEVGAQFNNWGEVDNRGMIDFFQSSSLQNYGVFDNNNSVWMEINTEIVNVGSLNNYGEIFGNNPYYSNSDYSSRLINLGNLNNSSNINNVDIVNARNINNAGSITTATLFNQATGVVENTFSGLINVTGEGVNFENNGTLNNSGIIQVFGYLFGYDQFNNTGIINNNGEISAYVSYLNNSGTINNSGRVDMDSINNLGGVINNAGEMYVNMNIDNAGKFTNTGALRTGPIGFTLNNYGEFNQLGSLDIYYPNTSINNYGVFNNGSEHNIDVNNYFDVVINNYGEFNNWNYIYGISAINNSGTINSFNSLGFISSLTNSGTLNLDDGVGVNYFINKLSGVFNNNFGNRYDPTSIDLEFSNQGMINNSGYLVINNLLNMAPATNSGTINNNLDLAKGYAAQLDIHSSFDNSGKINNAGGVRVDSGGIFNNFGEILNRGYMYINAVLNNTGLVDNSGQLDIQGSAAVNSGIINNYVDMSNVYTYAAININTNLINTGTINNSFGARIDMTGYATTNSGVINNGGDMLINALDNQGVIDNKGQLTIRNDWQVVNAGTINNRVDVPNFYMMPVINIESDINNKGTINNAYAAEINMSGYWSNYNSGAIHNDGRIQISSELINSGVITGAGEFNGNLVITEAGTLAPGTMDPMLLGRGMTIAGNLVLDGTFAVNVDGELPFYSVPQTNVYGLVALGENSVLDISFFDGGYLWDGMTFDLMSAYDISGNFGSFTYDVLFDNNLTLQWEILEGYGLGDLLRVSVVSSVPVPAAVWLFISGLAGLVVVSRRREKTLH